MAKKKPDNPLMRFIKGMFIGAGFILPGVSGGALAAVFGVYERIIGFLANITKDFKEKVIYLLPIALGGIAGVVLFSFAISFFLSAYEAQILWLFIGCILGTLPTLWRQAGSKGRKKRHVALMIASFAAGLAILAVSRSAAQGSAMTLNFGTWMLAGALIGLGVIVPGMSPSNFLIYLGMYKPMTDAIKTFDFAVILPLILGGGACLLLLAKLMNMIFQRAYAGMFHCILGIVAASTVFIVPTDFNYLSVGGLVCLLLFVGGVGIGAWMGHIDPRA